MKKWISTIIAIGVLLGTVTFSSVSSSAVETENKDAPRQMMVNPEIDYASAQYNENGTVFYDILNVEEMAEVWGVAPEKVRQMKLLSFAAQEHSFEDYGVSPAGLFSRIEIRNVVYRGQSCWDQIVVDEIVQNFSNATVTRTKELSASVTHTYTTNVEAGVVVDGTTLSSALGFTVTGTITVTDSISVELGPGESVEIIAVPLCDTYAFDVYEWKLFSGTNYVGYGYAHQVIGLCVTVYDR